MKGKKKKVDRVFSSTLANAPKTLSKECMYTCMCAHLQTQLWEKGKR